MNNTKRTPIEMLEHYRTKLAEAKDRVANKPRRGQVRRSSEEMVEHWTAKVVEAERRASANPLDREIMKISRQAKKLQTSLEGAGRYCPEVSARLGDLVEAVEEIM